MDFHSYCILKREFELHTRYDRQRPWWEPLAAMPIEVVPVLVREMPFPAPPAEHVGFLTAPSPASPAEHIGILTAPGTRKSWTAMLGQAFSLDLTRLLFGRRHSSFPFIEISNGPKHNEDDLPIDDLLDAMQSSQVPAFEKLLRGCGLKYADVCITFGQTDHGRCRKDTDCGPYPGPGVAIFRFFKENYEEIAMECLVAGFDHAESKMGWVDSVHSQSSLGRINTGDRPSHVCDFIALPQAEVSFNHVMTRRYPYD